MKKWHGLFLIIFQPALCHSFSLGFWSVAFYSSASFSCLYSKFKNVGFYFSALCILLFWLQTLQGSLLLCLPCLNTEMHGCHTHLESIFPASRKLLTKSLGCELLIS